MQVPVVLLQNTRIFIEQKVARRTRVLNTWMGEMTRKKVSYTIQTCISNCGDLPTFMNIPQDEGFLFSSSVLAVGLVVLVAIMAFTVIVWGLGVGPVYTN